MPVGFEDRKQSGSLAVADAAVTINSPGASTLCAQVTGTFVGTITWEASVDQTTFVAINALKVATGASATTTTGTGLFTLQIGGFVLVRARMSAYTSGTAVVTLNASSGGTDAGFVAASAGGGGGGGGPATIADGADVALGTTTDAGVTTDTTGTVVGFLRGSIIQGVSALAKLGIVTEAAPATDTASSGLNGRLQRIAQRLTSLIALVPAALTGSGNFKVSLQEGASGSIPSGAIASGALAAGSIAAGAGVSGALVDGAIATLGTNADAAVGDATGTVNAHARQIAKLLAGTLTADTEITAAALDGDTFDTAATALGKVGAVVHVMGAGGTLAIRPVAHTSATDGRANTLNGILTQSVPYVRNASNTNDAVRGANAGTGTTGTGVPCAAPMVWDGSTNYVRALGDTSGRQIIQGGAAAAAALAGNPVVAGISDGTNAQYLKQAPTSGSTVASTGSIITIPASYVGSSLYSPVFSPGQNGDGANGNNMPACFPFKYNGSTYDRDRNNTDVTLLASGARTTTQTSADIVTYNTGAITVILDVTNVAASPSVTISIDGKDPASGKYFNLLAGAAVTTAVTNVYVVDPAVPAVANVSAQKRLPRTIRIVVTANNSNSGTYSVGYTLQPC